MWVLILCMYAGTLATGDSATLTHIDGFQTELACKVAGEQSKTMGTNSLKKVRYRCVSLKENPNIEITTDKNGKIRLLPDDERQTQLSDD
jgi:hypothetical protein